jgi:drug/metabolite transporter (DMT)-like permease
MVNHTVIDRRRVPEAGRARAPVRSDVTIGLWLGFLGVAIFGATLPVTKLALADFSPWFITFARALLAGVAAAVTLAVLRRPAPWARWAAILASSLMLVVGFPGFMAVAMQSVPASHGGVVLGILPLATAIMASLIAGERPSLAFWGWGLAGAGLVLAFTLRESGLQIVPGDVWLFASGLCAATGYVIFGKLSRDMPGWEVICWALVASLPVTAIGSILTWNAAFAAASAASWAALGYAAFFSMFLGFFAWNAGLARGGIARVSQVQLLQSFVTIAVAAVLLGEDISTATLAFAAAVAFVVWMGRRAKIG